MAYSSGGLIEATDYNNLVGPSTIGAAPTASPYDLNAIWGSGYADFGYGQSVASNVSANTSTVTASVDSVTAVQWATMLNRINAMRQHQGAAAPFAGGEIPTTGDTIGIINNIQTNIDSAATNRFAFGAAGSTTTGSNFTAVVNLAAGTYSGTIATRTATWASADEMRYFFNCGGQLIFRIVSADNTDNDVRGNTLEGWLESNLNNIVIRGKSTIYGGVTGAPGSWSTSNGFYNLTTGAVNIFDYEPGGTYGTTDSVVLKGQVNGSPLTNSATSLTFNLYVAVLQGFNNSTTYTDTVNVIHRIDYIQPSTTYLSASWGVPTIT